TLTRTATRTPTPGMCPTTGATLVFEIDNQTNASPISIILTGERIDQACNTPALATSYNVNLECSGSGIVSCGTADGLAPGTWRHSVAVLTPHTGQLQHQTSMLVSDDLPNRVRFTAFATVLSVQTTANVGDGSLRNALQKADASPKPLLI